jgi:hypothetical protein
MGHEYYTIQVGRSLRVVGMFQSRSLGVLMYLTKSTTYRNQGRWDQAEELEVQVMETSKRVLGAEHPSTLTSMNNLAFTWQGTGRETGALRLMQQCVQLRKCILGVDHPHTLSSSTALAEWRQQEDVGVSV